MCAAGYLLSMEKGMVLWEKPPCPCCPGVEHNLTRSSSLYFIDSTPLTSKYTRYTDIMGHDG